MLRSILVSLGITLGFHLAASAGPAHADPCDAEVVVTDPSGDVAESQVDILSLAIGELRTGFASGLIRVRLRVRELSSPEPAPASTWLVSWQNPTGETRTTLQMGTCPSGPPQFSFTYQTPEGDQSGVPDEASFSPDGRIEIAIDRSRIGSPPDGEVLTGIGAVAHRTDPPELGCLPPFVAGPTDVTDTGQYTLGTCLLVAPAAPAARVALGPAVPNPTRAGVRFTLDVPDRLAGMELEIVAHDLAGRRLRTLATGLAPRGRTQVGWNLRSESGARLDPGTYWVRLRIGDEVRSRAVRVLR